MSNARFIYVADVFCPWCYGFGPIMKRVAEEHPEIPVKVIGGNLISRPITLAEDVASNPGLIEFWREVEQTVGLSLEGAINAALAGKPVRMYSPGADEILAELRSFAPGQELAQLLYLENMFYGLGEDMFEQAAVDGIANHWGIPAARFERALDSEAALAATRRNLAQAAELMGEIGSYPSVLLQKGDRIFAVSRGYVHYETVEARLATAMRDLDLEPVAHRGCSLADGCTTGRHA